MSLLSGDQLALRPSGIIGSIVGAVVMLAAWRPSDQRYAARLDSSAASSRLASGFGREWATSR